MILVVYLVVVIVMMSKQRKEGKVVSGWTRFIVYSLLVLSLISLLAGVLALSLVFNPLVGFYYMEVIGIMLEIVHFVNMMITLGLILLSVSIYLDSQKSQQPIRLSHQFLLFGFHIFLIILMLKM